MAQKDASSQARILFPLRDAAFVLGICPRKICYLIQAGELKVTRIGRRTLIHRSVLEAFARRDHPTPAASDVGAAARGGAKQ